MEGASSFSWETGSDSETGALSCDVVVLDVGCSDGWATVVCDVGVIFWSPGMELIYKDR